MNSPSFNTRLLAVAFLATAASVGAAEKSAANSAAAGDKSAPAAAASAAKPAAAATADVQKMMEQFGAQRDSAIASYQEQLKLLKDATDEKRKEILDQMQAQQKQCESSVRACPPARVNHFGVMSVKGGRLQGGRLNFLQQIA